MIQAEDLRFDDPVEVVGEGSFGVVLLAEYRGTRGKLFEMNVVVLGHFAQLTFVNRPPFRFQSPSNKP